MIQYSLKTWEQRWYLAAEPDNHHYGISIFSLERMDNIRLTEQKMLPSNDVTAYEYWKGSFGVNHSDNQVPERIVIKVYGTQVNYGKQMCSRYTGIFVPAERHFQHHREDAKHHREAARHHLEAARHHREAGKYLCGEEDEQAADAYV